MKKLMLLVVVVLLSCSCAIQKEPQPHRKSMHIATIKYMLSPSWTMVEFNKEVAYQEMLRRTNAQ